MPRLTVIIASTRPGRAGPSIGHWFVERARTYSTFEIRVVDLAELDLPLLDEANTHDFASTPSRTRSSGARSSRRPTRSCS